MSRLVALLRTGVSEERIASITDSFNRDDGGDTFLRIIGSHKTNMT
jgi:hypothetical protein